MNEREQGDTIWRSSMRVLAFIFRFIGIYLRPVRPNDLNTIRKLIRERFPRVRQLSTAELADWLTKNDCESPVLVDVREESEFAVSHIKGAHRALSESQLDLKTLRHEQPIVLYCSIGYRSSALAEKLMLRGYTNVFNLEGAIFSWANEGRPLFRGDVPVSVVHPYSAKWGKLLKPGLLPQA